jgi:hypothetical protein
MRFLLLFSAFEDNSFCGEIIACRLDNPKFKGGGSKTEARYQNG